jgi:mitochondrial distribution and morphology protein 31
LEDVLINVYQPGGFRPYTFSIFRADVGVLRKQWLFYDFLKSEGAVGQFDNCLFSLHRPQSIGRTNEQDAKDGGWSTMVRIPSSHFPDNYNGFSPDSGLMALTSIIYKR